MNIAQLLTKLKALIYSKSETDSLLGGKANSSHTHTKSQITDFPSLATVATSGSYTDLSNKPTIPSKVSQLSNDSGFITSTSNITGNAATATKLATARSISAGDLEFQGSANFDGSSNIKLDITHHRSLVTIGNTNNYPFHRIAYTAQETGNWLDRVITFFIGREYSGGGYGICRIVLRTNDAASGATASCVVEWLVRTSSIPVDAIQVGFNNTAAASYIDVFYKSDGGWGSAICRVISHASSRTNVGQGFTVVSTSSEVDNTTASNPLTSTESYATIAAAGTKIRGKAYTSTIIASDAGNVNYANSAGGVAWGNVSGRPTAVSKFTNDAGYLTSHQSLSNYSTLANTIKSLSISGKTITYTKGDNTTGTLTTQDTNTTYSNFVKSGSGAKAGLVPAPSTTAGTTKYLREDGTWQVPPDHTYTVNNATLTIQKNGSKVATFTANASSNVTANISVPTKVSQLTNDSGFITGVSWGNVSSKPSTFTPSSHTHTKSQITDFPTIPSKTSQLTNDSGFITSAVGMLEMKGNPPYIDFHASNDTTHDYTSRIIDDGTPSTGRLRLTTQFNSAHYQVELYKNFFEPSADNDIYLGDSTNRWRNIFCVTDSISTSDLRLKNTITDIDDSLLDAWGNIEPKQYKFNDATEEKGDKARYHTGYLAQDIQTECEKQGVNASDYGLFCYDEWDEQEEISEEIEKEKDGKIVKEKRIIQPKREKGDRYSLRYAEALVVECKYLRRENSRLKEKLASIEERLEKLEKAENS